MAASPDYKVYQAKEYRAACKYVEDAAALVAFLGDGAQIRWGHTLPMWTEGAETQPAGESYDHVAEVVAGRIAEHNRKMDAKRAKENADAQEAHAKRLAARRE